jgi:hypothetical protein
MAMRGACDQELKNRQKLLATGVWVLLKLKLIGIINLLSKKRWP